MVPKGKSLWTFCQLKFSHLIVKKIYGDRFGEFVCGYCELKGCKFWIDNVVLFRLPAFNCPSCAGIGSSREEANEACDNNKRMIKCAPDESVCVAGELQVSRSLVLLQRFCSSKNMLDEIKKHCEDNKPSADSSCNVAMCEIDGCTAKLP